MKTERFDIHQHITDKIVSAIERGAGEFRLPWHRSAGNILRPVNIASKKAYRGVNVLTLWATADEKGYGSGVWGTYKQWAEIGAQVRKGEKSAYIVFYKEITVVGEDGDSEGVDTHLFARATPVFAAEQVDGWAAPTIDAPATIITPIEQAEAFVAATGASITHGGSRAFYRPSTDSIHLPPREAFIGSLTSSPAEAYYSTLLHELTHYTSHESRCNRQLGKRFPMAAVRPVPAPPATPDTCSVEAHATRLVPTAPASPAPAPRATQDMCSLEATAPRLAQTAAVRPAPALPVMLGMY
jgi:antirestriction protein ArdC